MQANETVVSKAQNLGPKPAPIASWKHLAGFLLIMAGVMAFGFYAQHGTSTQSGQLAGHDSAIQIYLSAGFMDWMLLYYCWGGVKQHGGNLETLSGGRWKSWRDVLTDVAIAIPFWIVWEAVANAVARLLGPTDAKSVESLLPQSLLEIVIWIGVSITAGICEEMAFRGYLQRQFHALGGSVTLAIIAQALVFGVAHSYQGWRQVAVISVVGVLFGMLAAWRRNVRANMIAHAVTDIWEGWLKFLVFR